MSTLVQTGDSSASGRGNGVGWWKRRGTRGTNASRRGLCLPLDARATRRVSRHVISRGPPGAYLNRSPFHSFFSTTTSTALRLHLHSTTPPLYLHLTSQSKMLFPSFLVSLNITSAAVLGVVTQFLGQLSEFGTDLLQAPSAIALAFLSVTFWSSLPSVPTLSLPAVTRLIFPGENHTVRRFPLLFTESLAHSLPPQSIWHYINGARLPATETIDAPAQVWHFPHFLLIIAHSFPLGCYLGRCRRGPGDRRARRRRFR